MADIDAKVRSGAYQYHHFDNGFVLTTVTQYQNERVLDVVLVLGEKYEDWKEEALNRLTSFGREQGCQALEAVCRKGLEHVLKPLGWKRTKVTLRKEL